MTRSPQNDLILASAEARFLEPMIAWLTAAGLAPTDVVLCEESTINDMGEVVSKYWFEVKQ